MQRSKVTLSCTGHMIFVKPRYPKITQIPLTNFVSAIGWWLQLSTCSLNFGMMIASDTGFQIGWKQNQAKYGGVIINQRNLTKKYVEFSSRNRNLPMTCLSVEHGFVNLFFNFTGGVELRSQTGVGGLDTHWCWLRLKTTVLGRNYLLVDFLCLRMF